MLRDEKWGISGNGQKSYKRAMHKFNNPTPPGGGSPLKTLAGVWIDIVHYPWTGTQLEQAKPGGLGVIPIEDQFKSFSDQTGDIYVSYVFRSSPLKLVKQSIVYLEGKDIEDDYQVIKLDLKKKDAFLECTYSNLTIIWVKKKWVVTP